MRWRLGVVLLFVLVMQGARGPAVVRPARADAPGESCSRHECSDDADRPPILGNEFMRWEVPSGGAVDWYEVALDGEPLPELCDGWVAPLQDGGGRWSPYLNSGCFPHEGEKYYFVVRACTHADGCGEWSQENVEFVGQPYSCFESCGEVPCYPGAPIHFPEIACNE